ncbi:MAG: hypothetical protein K2L06_04445 [Alistipes sp.]|nr:hypothetical protein [Alistipes sp.]
MKRFINRYAVLALAGALVFGGCKDDHFLEGGEYVPALNSATLAPATNASGTQRAYVGTEVSVQGFNLDRLTAVTVADVPAEITAQNIKELKFRIPALELAQSDLPHEVELKAFGAGEEQFFSHAYYVTIPVTDASVSGYAPADGTVGTEITLSGRNLGQVTRIRFGSATVEAADFTEVDDEGAFVKFRVPAGDYAEPDSEVAIAAEWGTETVDVTGETPFLLHVPVFDALEPQPEGTNSAIGDELELTGCNLDLVTAVKWGGKALLIAAQSAEALTVRFPASIEAETPAVQSKSLVVEYGTPPLVQTVMLTEAWRVDTTPSSTATVPEFGQMTVEDGKFYLGKTVTVTGANLSAVEKIELQYDSERIEAAISAGATDSELKFTVPEDVTFNKASEVSVVALHNGGEQLEIGKATIYPFYYYKDVKLGSGSSSVANYPYSEFAWSNAFFMPDTGHVISTDEWVSGTVDSFALETSNKAILLDNKVPVLQKANITSEQYYGIEPYIFLTTGGDGKLAFQNPANSASQLKTHRYQSGKTAVSSTFGTPIIYFLVLKSGAVFDAVKDGSLTSIAEINKVAGSAAPAFGNGRNFIVGDVIAVQYVTYAKGTKPAAVGDIHKQGYIVVTEITCADPDKVSGSNTTAGEATDLTGYVKFDFYWSKTLNE